MDDRKNSKNYISSSSSTSKSSKSKFKGENPILNFSCNSLWNRLILYLDVVLGLSLELRKFEANSPNHPEERLV